MSFSPLIWKRNWQIVFVAFWKCPEQKIWDATKECPLCMARSPVVQTKRLWKGLMSVLQDGKVYVYREQDESHLFDLLSVPSRHM